MNPPGGLREERQDLAWLLRLLTGAIPRQVVFGAKDEDEWRCWPSGPLPPNTQILGTDQNIMTYGADEGVKVMATEGNGKFGIGVGLKQAHRGIEISDGRFGVQVRCPVPDRSATGCQALHLLR